LDSVVDLGAGAGSSPGWHPTALRGGQLRQLFL